MRFDLRLTEAKSLVRKNKMQKQSWNISRIMYLILLDIIDFNVDLFKLSIESLRDRCYVIVILVALFDLLDALA